MSKAGVDGSAELRGVTLAAADELTVTEAHALGHALVALITAQQRKESGIDAKPKPVDQA